MVPPEWMLFPEYPHLPALIALAPPIGLHHLARFLRQIRAGRHRVIFPTKRAGLIFAAALLGASPSSAMAKDARASFGVGLVIEPACPLNASGEAGAKMVPKAEDALRIAHIALADQFGANGTNYDLTIRHYRLDTGKWEVRQVARSGKGKPDGPSLLIDKCSGEISAPI